MKEISRVRGGFSAPETKEEREVETWRSTDPSRCTPEAVEQRREVTRWKSGTGPENKAQDEVTTWSGRDISKASFEEMRTQEEVDEWRRIHGPETSQEREATTWKPSESPEKMNERETVREEVTEWKYPSQGIEGQRGGMAQKMESKEAMAPMLNCPFCGEGIPGADEDTLSNNLRDHMMAVHKIGRK